LDVWQEGVELTIAIYRATESFPKAELYGLSAQMRRAAVSVPSNIAEGAARNTANEFVQFLHVAGGSLSELDTQILIAERLNYIETATAAHLTARLDAVSSKLGGLIVSVRRRAKGEG